jgi:Mn-containing catalase
MIRTSKTLKFLMTREIAHFQMFDAALQTIQPNFPPGVLQGDPKHSNTYFNMSNGQAVRGPWNEGVSPELGEVWRYIDDPISYVSQSEGLTKQGIEGTRRTEETVEELDKALSTKRSKEIMSSTPSGENQWSKYSTAPGATAGRTPNDSTSDARTTPGEASEKHKSTKTSK